MQGGERLTDAGTQHPATMHYVELRTYIDQVEASTPREVDLEVEEMALYIRLAQGAIAEMAFRRNMRLQGRIA